MTRPTLYLLRMGLFLCLVLAVVALLGKTLYTAFFANPMLDGLILFVLCVGILWNIRIVYRLVPELRWIEALRINRPGLTLPPSPRLLSPMARNLASRTPTGRVSLSVQSAQATLDSLSGRLDESREISRYMTSLLIFLGLLGTFYGLLLTVSSIADVIGGMTVGDSNLDAMFGQLQSGLAQPLKGMATAFSGSMFGLAGALILGFLDLSAGQAQNRFFNEVEEWLAGMTRQSTSLLENGETAVPAYVQALLEQTAENLETLQNVVSKSENSRQQSLHIMEGLQDRLKSMTDLLQSNQKMMNRVAEGQALLGPFLKHVGEASTPGTAAFSEARESREQFSRIEGHIIRLIDELHSGRAQMSGEIRNDLRLLARTIAASTPSGPQPL